MRKTLNAMRRLFYISAFLLVLFLITSAAQAPTVSLTVGNGKARKGKTTRGFVVLKIPKGLHVNSHQPESEFAIPTRVTVSAVGASAGTVRYPPGRPFRFAFSDEPISVYVGKVRFGFGLAVPSDFKGRTVRVRAKVRYQACTKEVCYAPKTKIVTLNVPVR